MRAKTLKHIQTQTHQRAASAGWRWLAGVVMSPKNTMCLFSIA